MPAGRASVSLATFEFGGELLRYAATLFAHVAHLCYATGQQIDSDAQHRDYADSKDDQEKNSDGFQVHLCLWRSGNLSSSSRSPKRKWVEVDKVS